MAYTPEVSNSHMTTRDKLGFRTTATANEHRPIQEPTEMHVAYARTTPRDATISGGIMQSRVPRPLI